MVAYRALISLPISADTDEKAWNQAAKYAHSLRHAASRVVAGHLELLGEVANGDLLRVGRVVDMDPHLLQQLPPEGQET